MGAFDRLPKDVRTALAESHSGLSPVLAVRLLRIWPVSKVICALAIADRHLCRIGGAA